MKAKLKNGIIVDVRVYMLNSGLGDSRTLYMDNDRGITYYEDELEFLPDTPEEVTIEGYVARGANPHHLALYERKPERLSDIWGFSHSLQLDPTFFPEITWGNSPKRVKITITPMEE